MAAGRMASHVVQSQGQVTPFCKIPTSAPPGAQGVAGCAGVQHSRIYKVPSLKRCSSRLLAVKSTEPVELAECAVLRFRNLKSSPDIDAPSALSLLRSPSCTTTTTLSLDTVMLATSLITRMPRSARMNATWTDTCSGPIHSIINQASESRLRLAGGNLNADGFGLGWYCEEDPNKAEDKRNTP